MLEVKDKLDQIFELQDELNSKFGLSVQDFKNMSLDETLNEVRNYLTVLSVEVSEAQLAAKARWWKIDKDWQGVEHVQEELIDCLHLLMSAMLAIGMDSQKVYDTYIQKNEKNNTRQDWSINRGDNE